MKGTAMQDATRHYINGQWVDSIDGCEVTVENPSTEEKVAMITLGGVADAEAAVAAAKGAFPGWAATDPSERITALERLMEVYKSRAEEMAQAISTEMGAPIALAKTAQVASGAGHLKNTIRTAKAFVFERPLGDHAPSDMILYEPVGVCALITPWNWPMNQVMLKVAPALAAGCTVVLKPSELSPLSAILLAEMIDTAGFPAGVFNLVNGDGAGVGAHLTAHPTWIWSASPARPVLEWQSAKQQRRPSNESAWSWGAKGPTSSSPMLMKRRSRAACVTASTTLDSPAMRQRECLWSARFTIRQLKLPAPLLKRQTLARRTLKAAR
jgi:hypothetical protein